MRPSSSKHKTRLQNVEAGRATLKREHEEMMQAARKELMQLVVSASRVTLGEVVTEELDKK